MIKGTDSDDILNGLAGNDILRGGKGKDENEWWRRRCIPFVLVGDVRAGEKVDNAADNAVLGSSIAALNGIDGQEAAGEIIRGGEGNDTLYVIGTVDLSTLTLEGG